MKHRKKHDTIDLDGPPRQSAPRGGRLRTARSRGAVSGSLLVALGLWGAVVPFVGPVFDFGFTPDSSFDWTAGRFWMQLLPGAVAALCGLALLATRNRAVGVLVGYLAAAAGAWFVVGPVLAVEELGSWSTIGEPLGQQTRRTVEQLTMFSGLGLTIAFLAALAVGRMTVRSVSDVEQIAAVRDEDAGLDIGRREEPVAQRDEVPPIEVRSSSSHGRHEDAVVPPTEVDGGQGETMPLSTRDEGASRR